MEATMALMNAVRKNEAKARKARHQRGKRLALVYLTTVLPPDVVGVVSHFAK
jgi:hypothetical protein